MSGRPDPTPADGPDPYGNPDPDPEWLRVDWQTHLRTADVRGTAVDYLDIGEGEPVALLVHGLSGSWQNWLENITALAAARRVVALDLPGFGGSPMPPWEITVEAYGRLLHDLAAHLGIGDCVAVGHSLGGFVAAEAASREPDRFEKLVLVSAAGISSVALKRRPTEAVARVMAATAPLGLKWQERALLRPRLRVAGFRQIVRYPLRLRRELLWEQFHHGAAKPGFMPALTSLAGYDFRDRLAEVEVPALVVWGQDDRIVPPRDAAAYSSLLTNSRTEILADTAHMPMLERPVRFNRLLEEFFSS